MSKRVILNIEPDLYQRLEKRFKNDEHGLNQFIIDPLPDEKDGLENYLKKGSSGSRTYGVKGQGW